MSNLNLAQHPALENWIGDEKDSPLVDDLEALTRIMPVLVLAKMNASEKDARRIQDAVEVVAMTIDNLQDMRQEIFA